MSISRCIAYYRVSTARQGRSGLGLDAQKDAVFNYLNNGHLTLIAEVTEVESGKHNDRPALAKALSLCRIHNATLIVAKVDRLSRNLHFITSLMESGVEFIACDLPVASRLTLHLMASFAEHEGRLISERTKGALAAAKRRGIKIGGNNRHIGREAKKGGVASGAVRAAAAQRRAADLFPVIEAIRDEGRVTLREIADGLNEKGIVTPRGSKFRPAQVMRLLAKSQKPV